MQSFTRCMPAVRQIRLSNTAFQRAAIRRPAASQILAQRRWQSSEATTSATHEGNHEHSGEGPPASKPAIKYTSETYPELKRDSKFAELTPEHVKWFRETLGTDSAILDGVNQDAGDDMEPFNSDWMRKYRGHAKLVVKPGNTEEVSKILKYCNDNMLAVVPQGGNTGLVGGSVPVFDEIVINLARMNQIRSFDDVSGILVADGGVILEVADNFLAEKNHIFPLDLGAKGSCQIGGNVATNAGGLRLLRYGSLHGNVLGLEAVLPDGTIVDDLCKLRKNNTGYDIKQLFIGGEGTIGIITGISILCPQRSNALNVAYFGLESFEKVQEAFREAKNQLGEILSAFELMDGRSQKLYNTASGNRLPLEGEHPFYCLIETSGSNTEHDQEKLEAFLEHVMGEEIVSDGVVAQDQTQIKELWGCREGVPEHLGHWGGVYKYDLSIPIGEMYSLVEECRERMMKAGLLGDSEDKPVVDVVGYGHMGDANLHLNVPVRRYDKAVEKELEPWVYEWVQKRHGSISAEHGLGIAKKPFIGYSRSETMVRLYKQIKDLYDPNGIMNPYKYI
ncbi:D-lactate ferricytochrome c oxidoreductase [Zalaria obscura]|uniref:D-lactate ferricytochrome c oxidoreductase n=1 Tax=Zalaria obscura TaxID=2024903 RepID=A0ACC3SDQ9_9PEZI